MTSLTCSRARRAVRAGLSRQREGASARCRALSGRNCSARRRRWRRCSRWGADRPRRSFLRGNFRIAGEARRDGHVAPERTGDPVGAFGVCSIEHPRRRPRVPRRNILQSKWFDPKPASPAALARGEQGVSPSRHPPADKTEANQTGAEDSEACWLRCGGDSHLVDTAGRICARHKWIVVGGIRIHRAVVQPSLTGHSCSGIASLIPPVEARTVRRFHNHPVFIIICRK